MYKLIALIPIAAIAFLMLGKPTIMASEVLKLQNQNTYAESSATAGGRCFEGTCLTIYVAPWCPVCKNLQPTIISLTKELQEEGIDVKVVVGNDTQKATEEYAKGYPFPVYLDADARFFQKAKQRGVPFFLVSNKKGHITSKLAGGILNVKAMRDKLEI